MGTDISSMYYYDGANRLVYENTWGDNLDFTDRFTYDTRGNRISLSDGETETSYSYDLNNRLTQTEEICGDEVKTTKYFYDNNGNQISKASLTEQQS